MMQLIDNQVYTTEQLQAYLGNVPKHYRDGNYLFAYYAAFVGVFAPDMLYQLWLNFQEYEDNKLDSKDQTAYIHIVAIADLLQSNLCRKIGYELYEMDKDVANYLRNLSPNVVGEKRQIKILSDVQKNLAYFTLEYAKNYYQSKYHRNLYDVYYWKSICWVNPEEAKTQLRQALNKNIETNKNAQRQVRILINSLLENKSELLDDEYTKLPQFSLISSPDSLDLEFLREDEELWGRILENLPIVNQEQTIFGSNLEDAKKIIQEAKEKRLKKVDLGKLGITDLDEILELFELEWLEELNISNSYWLVAEKRLEESKNKGVRNVLKSIPDDIKKLKKLKVLRVSGNWDNKWTIKDISNITNLENLKVLDLSSNQITDISNLSNLYQLETLDISYNKISHISVLVELNDLKHLYLRGNSIQDDSILSSLKNLDTLDLSYHFSADFSFLKNLSFVKTLYLRGNYINDISFLEDSAELSFLYLDHNQISDLSILAELKKLQYLNLSLNQIQDVSFLHELNQLQHLDLRNNKIEQISLDFLNSLTQLQQLYLQGNPIKDIPQEVFDKEGNCLDEVRNFLESKQEESEALEVNIKEQLIEILTTDIEIWDEKLSDTKPNHFGINDWDFVVDEDNLFINIDKKEFRFEGASFSADLQMVVPSEDGSAMFHKSVSGKGTFEFVDENKVKITDIDLDMDLVIFEVDESEEDPREKILNNLKNKDPYLDLSSCKILDLREIPKLQKCTHLESLNLSLNNISDIRRLKVLSNLKELNITNALKSTLSNLNSLSSLIKLTALELENHQIKDISPISSLSNLTHLNLKWNYITNISNLKDLKNLEILELSRNNIQDITVITNFEKLHTLLLGFNEITFFPEDILKKCINLKILYIRENPIQNIPKEVFNKDGNCLEELREYFSENREQTTFGSTLLDARKIINEAKDKKLKKLDLGNLDIKNLYDITEALSLNWLEELNLGIGYFNVNKREVEPSRNLGKSNKINYLVPNFANLINLKKLHINSCLNSKSPNYEINFSTLSYLPLLQELDISNNILNNVSINPLLNLKVLIASNTNIDNIWRILSSFPNIELLDLSNNLIDKLDNFPKNEKLTSINLRSNKIKEITSSFLQQIPNLKEIYLQGNPIQNIPKEIFDIEGNCLEDLRKYFSGNQKQTIFGSTLTDSKKIIQEAKEKKLKKLDLANLGLTSLEELTELFELKDLEVLQLGEYYFDWENNSFIKTQNFGKPNRIKQISAKIHNLLNINTLYLRNIGLESVFFLRNLKNKRLKVLDISENTFNETMLFAQVYNKRYEIALEELSLANCNMKGLQYFDLSKNVSFENFKRLDLSSLPTLNHQKLLTNFQNLEKLKLADNQLSNIGFLSDLKSLTSLDLRNNQISEISLEFIESLPNLKELYLKDNPIHYIPNDIFNNKYNCLVPLIDFLDNEKKELKIKFETLTIYTPPKHLTAPPFQPEVFLGREADLEALYNILFSNEPDHTLLIITGQAGIGKTSLASKYYQQYQDKYHHLTWLLAEPSILEAILQLALPLKVDFPSEMPNEDRLNVLLREMANLEKPCLLILDNANNLDDLAMHYLALKRCPNFHILLTSRINEYERVKTYKVGALNKFDALTMFKKYYPKHQSTEDIFLENIYEAIDGNTLVLEILAKHLSQRNRLKTNYTLQTLYTDISQKGLLQVQGETREVVWQTRGTTFKQTTLADILILIFDLSQVSESEIALLSVIAVLPPENISFASLENLLKSEDLADTLIILYQKGWLDYNEANNSFRCTSVAREIIRAKNQNRLWQDCVSFVDNLIIELDRDKIHIENFKYSSLYVRYAESILDYLPTNQHNLAILCEIIGTYYNMIDNLENAVVYFEQYKNRAKKLLDVEPNNPDFKNSLASSYSKLGETHTSLGNLDKAIEYFEQYNQLKKELYESYLNQVDFKNGLAISYEKLGETHQQLGNLDKALEYFEQYNQLEKELYESYPNQVGFKNGLAISYEKLGEIHKNLGNLEKARMYFEERNRLGKELYASYPQTLEFKNGLAISCEKLGETHQNLGNLDKARMYFEEFTNLTKELYESYPNQVDFKNGLAISYIKLGNHAELMKNLNQAKIYYQQSEQLYLELARDFSAYAEFQRNLQWVQNRLVDL
jgi:Leucine-rich repeat (LRR) protein/tetratricopeptide (TPR) repeat protein